MSDPVPCPCATRPKFNQGDSSYVGGGRWASPLTLLLEPCAHRRRHDAWRRAPRRLGRRVTAVCRRPQTSASRIQSP
eukprot:582263-Prymnesium_polylepis.1